jgi:hypothetical protein
MKFDENKVDDATLALLWLTMAKDSGETRSWKGFDWDTMNRLYEKGLIGNPINKAKSVIVTEEGEKRSEQLFNEMFGISEQLTEAKPS